ncbi:hypothetical protein CCYA_CCYA06G1843 [Cyanidiococcus yangmingshanensis]|nr:hypothetical protein CCYA_CCYA06G1843 [Cyanidiococcus yangmingshanensis]
MEVRRDVGEAGQSSKPTLSAPPQSLGKDAVSGSAVPEDVDDGLVRPADPSFMRTELERRRNQPVRTIAERRRLLREMRRRQVAAQEQRTLRETLETERSLPPDIDVEQLESVPLVRESLSGRERGEDYWLDLNELARRPGQIRKHERPRLSLLSKFLSGGLKIRAPDRKTNDQMTALEEEIEWRRLLQELKRSDRVSMQFQELTEEVPMLPGESVEEALGRSRLGSDQAVVRSPPASNDADDIDPAMLFQLKELEPAFSRLETSVQRRDNGSVLVIRRYVPRISARILELRDRRLRRKLRQERGQLSSKMRDQVRAELVLPYSQNWIALMVGAIGALVLLTWLFGQSGPIIELPDL